MNSKGLTIIELLISITIFSIMITGMTIAFLQQQRQFTFTQDAVDVDQTGRAVLDYIATEIRNAGSRQGKTFSLDFDNGGSGVDPQCSDNTADSGTVTTPPDCLEIYTWDITKGQDGNNLPSVPGDVIVFSLGPPLVLNLPNTWFTDGLGNPRTPPLIEDGDLIGVRSRFKLCNPDTAVNPDVFCITNPEMCTECAVILRVDINDQNQAVIDLDSDIIEQNFQDEDFTDLNIFINNFFLPAFGELPAELTIADSKAFRIDINQRELEMSQVLDANGEPTNFQPIAGGFDSPGIVDMQIVFNLQAPDGVITKVGVPSDSANRMFADFDELEEEANPALGSIQDIRSVEIYIVVRSNTRPRKIFGGFFRQGIPAIGDVTQRTILDASTEPVEGFVYRVLSTTVYVRNLSHEEFG